METFIPIIIFLLVFAVVFNLKVGEHEYDEWQAREKIRQRKARRNHPGLN